MRIPSERALNRELTEQTGFEVVRFEALSVAVGQFAVVEFEEVNAEWRQGIWFGTEGQLECNGMKSAQIVLWADTSSPRVSMKVIATDGILRLYNIWDSGRGLGDHESLSHTSGMLVSDEGWFRRYRCNDIGSEPAFEKLIFTLELTG